MKIHPNAVWGYPALPFIIIFILVAIGDIVLTIFFFDVLSYYLLLPLLVAILFLAFFVMRASNTWLLLSNAGIEYKKIEGLRTMAFTDMKEVVYTDNAYVGNNRKPCLYFIGQDGKVKHSFYGNSWNMKEIKAFYEAIPDTAVSKRVAEKGF